MSLLSSATELKKIYPQCSLKIIATCRILFSGDEFFITMNSWTHDDISLFHDLNGNIFYSRSPCEEHIVFFYLYEEASYDETFLLKLCCRKFRSVSSNQCPLNNLYGFISYFLWYFIALKQVSITFYCLRFSVISG